MGRFRAENVSRRTRPKKGMTGHDRNNLDPYNRLSCAVIASAGREYREIAETGGPGAPQQLQAIREMLRDPYNPWINYIGCDPYVLLESLDRDLARGKEQPITKE